MKKIGLVFAALLICSASIAQFRQNSQAPQQSNSNGQSLRDKLFFGLGGGLGFGTGYTYYSLLPVIGYKVSPQVYLGTTITYQHYSYTSPGTASYTQYGVGPFLRWNFYTVPGSNQMVFFQTQYELINCPVYNNSNDLVRQNFSRLLFGMGYQIPVGQRGGLNAVVMYDVLYKTGSPFGTPVVVRVFFTF